MIDRAIILNAGLGSRLRPLTETMPKCLTEVNGRPILEQQLDILNRSGFKEAVIVIGHLGQVIIDKYGGQFSNLKLTYVWNNQPEKTGTAYSLWLARDYLEGCFIIEGDIVVSSKMFGHCLDRRDTGKSYLVADKAKSGDSGCIIEACEGVILESKIIHAPLAEAQDRLYKSCGMEIIDSAYGQLLRQWLNAAVQVDESAYKEAIFNAHLDGPPLHLCDVSGTDWAEIDCVADIRRAEKQFNSEKYVIVILDGAADKPNAEGETPIEDACMDNLDALTAMGQTGLMRTIYPGLPSGSVVACLGLLGYNPIRYYPHGRASFEAIANNIYLEEGEIAFRCNVVRVDNGLRLTNATPRYDAFFANDIWGNEDFMIETRARFHRGQGFRNILVLPGEAEDIEGVEFLEPHAHVGESFKDLMPIGNNDLAEKIKRIMIGSIGFNTIDGTCALFPWSPSVEPWLPSFHSRHGKDGAIISAMDFFQGIGTVARMQAKRYPGINGDIDTDLANKLRYTKNELKYNDVVIVHINGPDEASHRRDRAEKVAMLNKIDREFIGPLIDYLGTIYRDTYRLAVLPDHYTYAETGAHGDEPVPYVVYGYGKDGVERFSERAIAEANPVIIKSYEFMDLFLKG